jgi:hybrid cluster-associated redox disulfide protein
VAFFDSVHLFAPAQRRRTLLEIELIAMKLDVKMTVGELLKVHPAAVAVFITRKLLCLGCPAETFHTLEDVARLNGIVLKQMTKELQAALRSKGKSCAVGVSAPAVSNER